MHQNNSRYFLASWIASRAKGNQALLIGCQELSLEKLLKSEGFQVIRAKNSPSTSAFDCAVIGPSVVNADDPRSLLESLIKTAKPDSRIIATIPFCSRPLENSPLLNSSIREIFGFFDNFFSINDFDICEDCVCLAGNTASATQNLTPKVAEVYLDSPFYIQKLEEIVIRSQRDALEKNNQQEKLIEELRTSSTKEVNSLKERNKKISDASQRLQAENEKLRDKKTTAERKLASIKLELKKREYSLAKLHRYVFLKPEIFPRIKRSLKKLSRKYPYSPIDAETEIFERLSSGGVQAAKAWIDYAIQNRFAHEELLCRSAYDLLKREDFSLASHYAEKALTLNPNNEKLKQDIKHQQKKRLGARG